MVNTALIPPLPPPSWPKWHLLRRLLGFLCLRSLETLPSIHGSLKIELVNHSPTQPASFLAFFSIFLVETTAPTHKSKQL